MRAKIQLDMKLSTPSEAQRILVETCERLKSEGIIKEYHFEIETADGIITEVCVLESEKVIA